MGLAQTPVCNFPEEIARKGSVDQACKGKV
jgi:hypothetical protein